MQSLKAKTHSQPPLCSHFSCLNWTSQETQLFGLGLVCLQYIGIHDRMSSNGGLLKRRKGEGYAVKIEGYELQSRWDHDTFLAFELLG